LLKVLFKRHYSADFSLTEQKLHFARAHCSHSGHRRRCDHYRSNTLLRPCLVA